MAALSGFTRVVEASGSIPTAAVLTGVRLYARIQSLAGQGLAQPHAQAGAHTLPPRSLRSALVTSRPARHLMRFKMRDGSRVRCRIVDAGGLLSVHVDRDYDVPGVEWSTVRTIVDIGAHVGTFTIWAALRSPQARCLAVEPNPNTFALLVENLRDNGLQDRVTAINAAAGPRSGTGSLELMQHSLGTRLARAGTGEVSVYVQTLASLLVDARMDRVDLLKVDCEGMEYQLFGADSAAWLSVVGVLACEYHPEPGHDVSELDTIIRAAGFTVTRPDTPLGVLTAIRPV
jgi:FkbM family methyltransferase